MATVREIISGDQELAALANVANDIEIASRLNDKTVDGLRKITSRELLTWAAQQSRLSKIETAKDSGNAAVASVARIAAIMLLRPDAELDLAAQDHAALVDALVSADVLSADDRTSLYTLAATKISRAEQNFGRGYFVTPQEVGAAR